MLTNTALSAADRLRLANGARPVGYGRPSVARPSVVAAQADKPALVNLPVGRLPVMVALNPEASTPPGANPFERSRKQFQATPEALVPAARLTAALAEPINSSTEATTKFSPARARMLESLRASTRMAQQQTPVVQAIEAVQAASIPSVVSAVPAAGTVEAAPQKMTALARLRAAMSVAPSAGLGFEGDDFGEPESSSAQDSDNTRTSAISSTVASVPQASIVGRLVTIKEFSGWAIGTLFNIESREEFRVKGEALMGLKEGLEYRLFGNHTTHANHGEGFDVTASEPVISQNDDALEIYLARAFDGIGAVKASKYIKLVRAEGGDAAIDALRTTLLTEPWKLDLTKIDKKAKFSSGEDPHGEIKNLMVARSLTLRLGRMPGFKESMVKALASHLLYKVTAASIGLPGQPAPDVDVVAETWALLMKNPYSPIRKSEGYGFLTAEAVAVVAGIPRTSDLRLSALVEYAVEVGCQQNGHTYLRAGQLVDAIRRIDPSAAPQAALNAAVLAGCVVVDAKRVYSSGLHASETGLAENIAKLMLPTPALTERTADDVARKLKKDAAKINPDFKDGFDDSQIDAVAGIMTSKRRIHVLTGGPGTGKTAIIEAMLALLPNKKFAFAAPTGQAAKVLTSRVSRHGYVATTMHSLLQGSEEGGFKVNAEDPLEVDALVLDESTMNGIGMANAALNALPPHAHLIILGDPGLPAKPNVPDSARAGQLPSISPGRFMQDLLLVPGINHFNLTKTHRNDGGILDVVKQTARGDLQTTDLPSVSFSHGLPTPQKGFPVVMQEYLTNVLRDGIENTLLVMPMRKGDRETPGWNSTYANHVLRATCNPHGEKIPGTTMFLGDRIIIRENQKIKQPKPDSLGSVTRAPVYVDSKKSLMERIEDSRRGAAQSDDDFSLGRESGWNDGDGDDDIKTVSVVNGDIGTIAAFFMASNNKRLGSPQWLELKLDDGRMVYYPGSEMAALQHSYALTVHSTQGSERTNVTMVVTPGNESFMNQNMLLTGFSRAKSTLSIHGDDVVIKKIAATPMPSRNSALVERVVSNMEKAMVDASDDSPEDECSDEIPF